jgi:hypothetical protein
LILALLPETKKYKEKKKKTQIQTTIASKAMRKTATAESIRGNKSSTYLMAGRKLASTERIQGGKQKTP